MIISSWNVNSIRARIENVKNYLNKFSPDIVFVQEIKTEDKTFPYDEIKSLGYESYVFGQKSYNGVAILSKKKLLNVKNDIIKDKNKQSRIITADLKYRNKTVNLVNVYIPNGNPVDSEKYIYKKKWLDNFLILIKTFFKKNQNIIIGGDFNVIPTAEDVYNSKSFENDALFKLEIRKKFREILNIGFNDTYRFFYPDTEDYTFWDYMRGAWQKNNGMRIDHFLVSNSLIRNIKDIKINKYPRGKEKPSDHTPIEITID